MFLSLIVVPVMYWAFDRGLAALGFGEKKKVEFDENYRGEEDKSSE